MDINLLPDKYKVNFDDIKAPVFHPESRNIDHSISLTIQGINTADESYIKVLSKLLKRIEDIAKIFHFSNEDMDKYKETKILESIFNIYKVYSKETDKLLGILETFKDPIE